MPSVGVNLLVEYPYLFLKLLLLSNQIEVTLASELGEPFFLHFDDFFQGGNFISHLFIFVF